MANTIYIKSSQTADSTPDDGSQLVVGEIAINTADGFLFMAKRTTSSGGAIGDSTDTTSVKVGMPINDSDSLSTSDATLSTTGNIKAYADTMLPLAGGTMTGAITMGAHTIVPTGYDIQIADAPGSSTDAANKAYVDAAEARAAQGLVVKANVVAATTASFTMASTASATTLVLADGEGGFSASGDTLTIDGVSVATGGRVLIKNGVNSNGAGVLDKWNGVYTAADPSGGTTLTLTRGTDMDATGDQWANAFLFVAGGTTNADTGWVSTVDEATITVGTTAVTFAQFNSAGTVTAGTNMSKVGNTLNVDDAFLKNNADDSTSHALTILGAAGLTINDATTTGTGEGGNLVLASDDDTVMVDTHRLGVIEFKGAEDTSNTLSVGAKIQAVANGTWAGSDNDGILQFFTTNGTTQTKVLELDEAQLATFSGEVIGTGFTGTLDGVLGGGTAAAATVTSLDAGSGDITTTGLVTTDRLKLEGGTYDTILDPGTPTANVTYTLPLAGPGTNAYVLASTTAGVMSWTENTGGIANDAAATITLTDTATSAVSTVMTLKHKSTAVNANGGGVGMDFTQDTGGAGVDNYEIGMQLEAVMADVSVPGTASEDFDFSVKLMAAGAAAVEKFKVSSIGDITFAGILDGGSF